MSNEPNWVETETSTYQHHVIHHVLGATVLGWVLIEDALHMLLDIGLLWTIYVNAEMSLMAQHVAIQDLESDALSRAEVALLSSDACIVYLGSVMSVAESGVRSTMPLLPVKPEA